MALFYVFIFATWALGLLSWLVALSSYIDRQKNKREEHQLEIIQRKALFNRLGQMTGGGPFNLPSMPTNLLRFQTNQRVDEVLSHPPRSW